MSDEDQTQIKQERERADRATARADVFEVLARQLLAVVHVVPTDLGVVIGQVNREIAAALAAERDAHARTRAELAVAAQRLAVLEQTAALNDRLRSSAAIPATEPAEVNEETLDLQRAAARAPHLEQLPGVIRCAGAACWSTVKDDALPSGWGLVEGQWLCAGCLQWRAQRC